MKVVIINLLGILILAGVIISNNVQASDREVLLNIKTELWSKAYKTQDTELLSDILHDSFQMIGNDGTRSNKNKELESLSKTPWNPSNFSYTVERLDIYPNNVAVIDGKGETDSYSYYSSNVLIKSNGKWQAVLSHVSGFKTK